MAVTFGLPCTFSPTFQYYTHNKNIPVKHKNVKWKVRCSQHNIPKSTVDVQKMMKLLYEDLPNVFGDKGIDSTVYDEKIMFRDPITRLDTLDAYLFNLSLLKHLFSPHCQLHWVKQTGTYEITSRWTMVMKYKLLPWKPELVFTGKSVMEINPATGKFFSHVDYWDSIKANDYFSLEGLWDVFRQMGMYKAPDFETPKYQILKRTADYEVRKYDSFIAEEIRGEELSGSAGLNSNASFYDRNQEAINTRELEGLIFAALKFSGKPTEEIVRRKDSQLHDSLIRDGLRPGKGCLLARYNDPDNRWDFITRNEVLKWVEGFSID